MGAAGTVRSERGRGMLRILNTAALFATLYAAIVLMRFA